MSCWLGVNQPIGIATLLFGNYIVSQINSLVKYLFNYFTEKLDFWIIRKSCLAKIGRQLNRCYGSAGDQGHGSINAADVGNDPHCYGNDQHGQ